MIIITPLSFCVDGMIRLAHVPVGIMLSFMTIIGTRPMDFMYMILTILGVLMSESVIQGLINPFVMAELRPTHQTELIPAYGKESWFTKMEITRAQFLGQEFKATIILKGELR